MKPYVTSYSRRMTGVIWNPCLLSLTLPGAYIMLKIINILRAGGFVLE